MRQLYYFFRCALLSAFLLFLSTAAIRAQHYYYVPNSIFMPSLSEKNDAEIHVGLGRGPDVKALEVQAAYSPVRYGAVVFNYLDAGSQDIKNRVEIGATYRFAELGLCAYQTIPNGTTSLTAGYGRGELFNHYGGAGLVSSFHLQRWYVQPALQYRSTYFEGGFSLRFSRLSYLSGDIDFTIEPSELEAIRNIENSSPFFLPEMGLSGAIRLNPILIKLVFSSIFSNTSGLNFDQYNLGVFLGIDLGDARHLSAKKKQKSTGKQ